MDHNSAASLQSPQSVCRASVLADARLLWVACMGPIVALLLLAIPAFSQTMPENASARSYGDGWVCNIGYRVIGDDCAAIVAPENAYETNRAHGSGWECHHGYRMVDETACVAVDVPEGGYLDYSGERWRCLRGFFEADDACHEVVVPENGYLVDAAYGNAWECDRGFERADDSCTAIVVPLNGYLNDSNYGLPWACDRGFFEQGGLCIAVVIPEFAYFDDSSYGEGWRCQRGYEASSIGCDAIEIPANAHLNRSGNRWECNRNFQQSRGQCLLNN